MGLTIIVLNILVLSILWFIIKNRITKKNDYWAWSGMETTDIVCTILIVLTIIPLIIFGCMFATKSSERDTIIAQYENLKQQTEEFIADDVLTEDNLRVQVLKMNNKIVEHKAYVDNWLVGAFYIKEVGELPLLDWENGYTDFD